MLLLYNILLLFINTELFTEITFHSYVNDPVYNLYF